MENSRLSFPKSLDSNAPGDTLTLEQLAAGIEDWLLSGELAEWSANTLSNRRLYTDKLLWFLRVKGYSACGPTALKAFFLYLRKGHEEEGGRWGVADKSTHVLRRPKPSTINAYHNHLSALFHYLEKDRHHPLAENPMAAIEKAIDRPDQIQPFSEEQVNSLLAAANQTTYPLRDSAILWFLFDSGVRVSELCALDFADVDLKERSVTVTGKGNKRRKLYFGKECLKALWSYMRSEPKEGDDPLFLSERGRRFTRSGLLNLVRRLGKKAGITSARCSPHTFRHTFAVMFLRNGGDSFTLQQLLGHTDLKMTNRYVKLAQADLQNQHRQFSPGDRLKRRKS